MNNKEIFILLFSESAIVLGIVIALCLAESKN